jgi:hypothetical protein
MMQANAGFNNPERSSGLKESHSYSLLPNFFVEPVRAHSARLVLHNTCERLLF